MFTWDLECRPHSPLSLFSERVISEPNAAALQTFCLAILACKQS